MKVPLTNVVRKFYVDGRVEECDEQMTLEQLQAFVGGDIEFVGTILAHRGLYCCDTALMEDPIPPINHAATRVVRPGTPMLGGIRGNALLFKC